MKLIYSLLLWALILGLSLTSSLGQTTEAAVVRGVLFYQPFCDECPAVLDEFLFPITDQYGPQLELLPVDTSEPGGTALQERMLTRFAIPEASSRRPILVVGDRALTGSEEILGQFPGLLDAGLAQGGVGWPEIEGLQHLMKADTAPAESKADPIAMALAWAVMIGMLMALTHAVWSVPRILPIMGDPTLKIRAIGIPVLALAGLAISAYLLYVKLSHGEVVCGPVGNCNLVQSSPYASILGIPMAALGAVFYLSICAIWIGHLAGTGLVMVVTGRLLVVASVFGTLFSVYLTSLELFIIHAVCAWCLASAVLTTLIMLLMIGALKSAATAAEDAAKAERRA